MQLDQLTSAAHPCYRRMFSRVCQPTHQHPNHHQDLFPTLSSSFFLLAVNQHNYCNDHIIKCITARFKCTRKRHTKIRIISVCIVCGTYVWSNVPEPAAITIRKYSQREALFRVAKSRVWGVWQEIECVLAHTSHVSLI